MPTTLPGVSPERGRRGAAAAGPAIARIRPRSRRCSARSGAPTPPPIRRPSRWPRPPFGSGRAPSGRSWRRRAGTRAGRRRRSPRARPAVARGDARHDRRAGRRLDRATRLPGWTSAWTAPGARPHGHDVDGRAHAGRASASSPPSRRGSTSWAAALRASRRACRERAAPSTNRWAARPGCGSSPIARRWRAHGVDRRWRERPPTCSSRGGQVGEVSVAGRRCACASRPTCGRRAAPRATTPRESRVRPRRGGRRSRCRSRCWGGPRSSARPR